MCGAAAAAPGRAVKPGAMQEVTMCVRCVLTVTQLDIVTLGADAYVDHAGPPN